jgi:hypothetical protein
MHVAMRPVPAACSLQYQMKWNRSDGAWRYLNALGLPNLLDACHILERAYMHAAGLNWGEICGSSCQHYVKSDLPLLSCRCCRQA